MATVYILKNTIDELVYIGSTTQPLQTRLREHKSRARRNRKYRVYDVMREYGVDNFYIEPLQENVEKDDLLAVEQEYIKGYPDKSKLLNTKYGISYSDMQYIVDAYKAGKRVKEIAAERGHCSKNVSRILKEHGVELFDWNECQRIEMSEEDLRRLYVDEMKTAPEIAEIYNTSHQTVLKRLKKYNIPIRKAVNRKYLKNATSTSDGC